jgi:hypothetical protein
MSDEKLSLKDFRAPKRSKQEHPKGFEPGVQWEPGKGGHLTVIADSEPDSTIWLHLIEDWDLDSDLVEVVPGTVQVRAWDSNMGEGKVQRFKYYRATLRPKDTATSDEQQADVEELIKFIKGRKPVQVVKTEDIETSYLVLLSDWQVGNGEAGGTDKIIEQILASRDRAVTRAKQLRKLGLIGGTVVLAGLGDLAEGCFNWYPMQAFSVDRNIREQDRVVRHLIIEWIDGFVTAGFKVIVFGCAGNHGEQRVDGKAYTSFDDNRDVQAFEIVAEILADNPRYEKVFFPQVLDTTNLCATLDISGVPCSFVHGHQFGSGGTGNKINAIEKWLSGQVMGRRPVGDCEILFNGHFHHFLASEATGRQIFQSPASDTGSQWFTNSTGKGSYPGVLTLVIGRDAGYRGWNELAIL